MTNYRKVEMVNYRKNLFFFYTWETITFCHTRSVESKYPLSTLHPFYSFYSCHGGGCMYA